MGSPLEYSGDLTFSNELEEAISVHTQRLPAFRHQGDKPTRVENPLIRSVPNLRLYELALLLYIAWPTKDRIALSQQAPSKYKPWMRSPSSGLRQAASEVGGCLHVSERA